MLNDQLQLRHYDDVGEGFEYEGQTSQRPDNKSVAVDEIDSAKFALFCKWLNESNFETKRGTDAQQIDKDSSDDEFVDSNNETVPIIYDKQFKETLPSVIEQANISSTVHETKQIIEALRTILPEENLEAIDRKESDPESKLEKEKSEKLTNEEHVYETLVKMPSQTNLLELPNQSLLSLNLSCASSASDLTSENGNPRRPVSHNKGKAPPPPSILMSSSSQSISDKTTDATPQEKEKKKKNLLTYIPSIFKPITPSNSSKNLFKETDI